MDAAALFELDRTFKSYVRQKEIENLLRLAGDTGAPPVHREWAYARAYLLLAG